MAKKKKGKDKNARELVRDRHYLYSAAVQSVDADVTFFNRVYRARRGQKFRLLREDFCGTAVLAHEWVRRHRENQAWGVDLDADTIQWGVEHYGPRLKEKAERLHLLQRDVLEVERPQVDVVVALNFSYSVFKQREQLLRYFRKVRRSLRPGGIFFIDSWGGSEVMAEDTESRKISTCTAFDGTRVPGFVYIWEQSRFNPVDHHIVCHISFKLKDGKKIKRAFTYDWRLWTLPELQELMLQAGFTSTEVHVEGWDDEEDDSDGIFRKRSYFENQSGWVAYVVGLV
jgi:SAM-dependent methyltransferase